MRVRKAIQKIAAIGIGAGMLATTFMGAMAADLKDYPNPMFIGSDGVFNGVLVVGANADSSDVVGMTNIMAALQAAAVKEVPVDNGNTETITVGGDSKKIETSTNKLEIGETLTSTGITSLTGSDLAALKDTSFTNSFGTSTVKQSIDLDSSAFVRYRKDSDTTGHNEDVPTMYAIFPQDSVVYDYKVEFTPPIKSEHNSDENFLKDIRDKKLNLLGREFTIQKADHPAANDIKLVLMSGSKTSTLEEGAEKTITIGSKDYDVKADFIGSSTARFIVNGETTDTMSEGDTYKLSDGTDIGVKTILAQNLAEAGQGDKVEFYLGADKVEIEDTNTALTNVSVGTVTINGESVDALNATIASNQDGGITNGADTTISSIEIKYKPTSKDYYLAKDDKLSTFVTDEEGQDGVMFLNAFDYEFKGLQAGRTEDISFTPSGNNNYKVKFKNKAGNLLNQNLIGRNDSNSSQVFLGELSGSTQKTLIADDTTPTIVEDNEYAILCDGVEYGYGYIVQYKGTANSDNLFHIKELFSGETYDVNYNSGGVGTLRIDGHDYTVTGDADGDDSPSVTFTGGCSYIYTQYGAKLNFEVQNVAAGADTEYAFVNLTTEPTEDSTVRDTVTVSFKQTTDSKVDVAAVTGFDTTEGTGAFASGSGIDNGGDGELNTGYSSRYGVSLDYKQPSNDQDSVTFTYPDDEPTAALFVTSGATTTTTGGSGGTTTQEVQPIPVSAVKLDTELADVRTVNAIVVGGPCANSAAKDLMGDPVPCAKDFQTGHAKIKLYTNGGNVAMLVAGNTAMDTRRAAVVLSNYKDYATKLVGDEVDVSGTTLSDITVGTPVVTDTTTTE